MSHEDTRGKLLETLKKFDTFMVVNEARDGTLRARPMAIAEIAPSGELWFVTARDTEKVREVHTEGRAMATGQASGAYVSVSGHMDIVEDRAKVEALWSEAWKAWFPAGKSDPQIVFMRLRPESGEYWSTGGAAGIRYLFEAAKAIVTGERVQAGDADQHARVRL